jgi:hypothetical protein
MSESQSRHIPHSSADDIEYVDRRGISIFKSDWDCPNCGDDGELMYRPGSKSTCAKCFWVVNGSYNDHVLRDWPLTFRDAQKLLADREMDWHGTPGDVANRLHGLFDRPEEAAVEFQGNSGGEFGTKPLNATQLGDFS